MSKPILNKLSEDIVNKIAAGEVVERPSSVVKELLDNAIDAQATEIEIKVVNGGIDLIEISDNGIGIPKDNLGEIFDSHTTSKISSIEDLNTLMSMGFRGEALSSITSVSKVKVVSKYVDEKIGNEVSFEGAKSSVKSSPKESGTTVRVENIFYNIPARQKYLKSAQTEYRKIYELLSKYILVYPNIAFKLFKDGKKVLDIKSVEGKVGDIKKERIKDVMGDIDLIEIKSEGEGTKISGLIAHPSSHSNTAKQIMYVNNRNIYDKGIARAVYEGYSRFLPFGQKVSFIINIQIRPELIDVNVHPRKEEIRFQNPYRVYMAIEEAVRYALEKELSYKKEPVNIGKTFQSIRENFNNGGERIRDISFNKKYTSVKDSLLFSKEILTEQEIKPSDDIRNIFQIFDKYIVIEFIDERLWIIDQHAAAERINFERLTNREKGSQYIQTLLVPIEINLTKEQILFVDEYKRFFEEIGFKIDINEKNINLLTIPSHLSNNDLDALFNEIFSLTDDIETLSKDFKRLKEDILATVACHGSVRSGQALDEQEMRNIFKTLMDCSNPYSCPHGRPAIWKLTLSDIDKNFERTY
ncbi:MAG: DNA mismatch repair endonuclease MutL [Candidatus Dojkabacteria bacterium]|nr:DNA mismatch repair endonuclease MutL [Candidatus Dojkabacteria bacterium]